MTWVHAACDIEGVWAAWPPGTAATGTLDVATCAREPTQRRLMPVPLRCPQLPPGLVQGASASLIHSISSPRRQTSQARC